MSNWATSQAKQLLLNAILHGTVSLDNSMQAMEVYNLFKDRPEFHDIPYQKPSFAARLRALRKQISEDRARSALDSVALAHDRQLHPRPMYNHSGKPTWADSDAQRMLRHDMDLQKHAAMAPRELYHSREVYQEHSLTVFREHIHQEVRRRKYFAYRHSRNAASNNGHL